MPECNVKEDNGTQAIKTKSYICIINLHLVSTGLELDRDTLFIFEYR